MKLLEAHTYHLYLCTKIIEEEINDKDTQVTINQIVLGNTYRTILRGNGRQKHFIDRIDNE